MGRDMIAGIMAFIALAFAAANPCAAAPQLQAMPAYAPKAPPETVQSLQDLGKKMASGSMRVSRVLGHPVTFEAPNYRPESIKAFADTADRTAQAFEDSTLVLNGREKTISITRVLFVEGGRSDVSLQGDVLKVTIAAQAGMAGPPSERIFHFLATQATA